MKKIKMADKSIKKYDERGNLIYVYYENSGYKIWRKFDKNNKMIYWNTSCGDKEYYKWEDTGPIIITEQEFNEIEFKKEEKEYLSRTKVSRFKLMEI